MNSASYPRPVAVLWTGGSELRLGPMLAAGAAVWLLYSLTHLLLNGPILDETLLGAQMITGTLRYPAGHPQLVFCRRAFSLSYNLAALTWHLTGSPGWICGVRNVTFLFCSTFVPFAAVVLLTRRPMWGHVAAVLTLSETVCSFVGVYLNAVFPAYYSSGHVGIHVSVLVAVLLSGGFAGLGGLLLGLLPGLHVTMALVVAPWAAAFLALRRRLLNGRRFAAGLGLGFAVCAALAVVVYLRTAGDHPSPPYDVTADGPAIRQAFMQFMDPHRQPIRLTSAAYLVCPVAFAALGALLCVRRARRFEAMALVALGGIAWAYVLSTRAWWAVVGSLPDAVAMIMPGRFANLPAILLLPLSVAVLADAVVAAPVALGIAVEALVGLLAWGEAVLLVVDRPLLFRQLVFVVWGVMFAVCLQALPGDRVRRAVARAGCAALLVALAVTGRDGIGSMMWLLTAAVGTFLGLRVAVPRIASGPSVRGRGLARRVLAGGLVAAAVAALPAPHLVNGWDAGSEVASPYEQDLAAWLERHATPDDMLLSPLWPPTLLHVKTGHPVLVELITLLTLTYVPELAPSVGMMVRDLFGLDFARPETFAQALAPDGLLRPNSPAWLAGWRNRTCSEWQGLSGRYAFRFVLSPVEIPLRLLPAFPGEHWTLYAVPPAGACEDRPT